MSSEETRQLIATIRARGVEALKWSPIAFASGLLWILAGSYWQFMFLVVWGELVITLEVFILVLCWKIDKVCDTLEEKLK